MSTQGLLYILARRLNSDEAQNLGFQEGHLSLHCLLIAIFIGPKIPLIGIIATILAYYFMDAGHVFSTLWRVYFNPKEFNRNRNFYIFTPLIIFAVLGTAFQYARFDFLMLQLFLATTTWHSVRQYHGINRWYQKLNKLENWRADIFFQFLCLFPFLQRNARHVAIILNIALLLKYQHEIATYGLTIYVALFLMWVFYEAKNFRGSIEINRLLATIFPVAMFASYFFYEPLRNYNKIGEIALRGTGSAFAHGFSYMALTQLALQRTNSPLVANKTKSILTIAVALALGLLALKLSSFARSTSWEILKPFMAFHTTAFFSHVVFDTFIWRGDHPEAKLIYQTAREA